MFYNFGEFWAVTFILGRVFSVENLPVIGYIREAYEAASVSFHDRFRDVAPPGCYWS